MLRLRHDRWLSWQKARPVHPESRPRSPSIGVGAPIDRFNKLPALIEAIARDHPDAERIEIWFLDP